MFWKALYTQCNIWNRNWPHYNPLHTLPCTCTLTFFVNTRIRVWSNESTLILFLSPVEFPTIPGHLRRPQVMWETINFTGYRLERRPLSRQSSIPFHSLPQRGQRMCGLQWDLYIVTIIVKPIESFKEVVFFYEEMVKRKRESDFSCENGCS